MKNTRKFFFAALGLLIAGFFVFGDTSILKAQSTLLEMDGFAWANTNDAGTNGPGWIYFKDPLNDPATWQVTIDASGNLNGYAWANPVDAISGEKNFGWVKFGGTPPLSGFPTGSGTTATNARLNGSNILGWARFCSATQNTMGTNIPGNCSSMNDNINGGWDGWISFQGDAEVSGSQTGSYGVTVGPVNAQGQRFLSGFAWGGPLNVGWIDMSQVFIQQPPANGKSQVTFTANTTSGTVIANKQTPIVSTSTNSGVIPNVSLTWSVLEVTNCVAGGDWVSGNPSRSSTNGMHVWLPLTFTNSTTSVITKKFTLTCQGDENSTGVIGPISREITVSILPGGNVASVVVDANPNTVFPTGTTSLSWTSNKINAGSCVGSSTFNGTPLVSPLWTGSQTGTNGSVAPVPVAGFTSGDSTIYKLTCTKVLSATGTPCPGDPVNTVCGYDTVSIGEGADLILQAHKDGYTTAAPTPIVTSVNAGEKVSLVWRSISGKQLRCSAVPGTFSDSNPYTATWSGPQGDVLMPTLENFKNGVEVLGSISIYDLLCAEVGTNYLTNGGVPSQAIVTITGGLKLSLLATDEDDGDSLVEEGGKVQIDIKKTGGSFDPGSCYATTTPINTSWIGSGPVYDPDDSFPNITTGGAPVGTTLTYTITCTDSLTLQPESASDTITIIPKAVSNIDLNLTPTASCIEPGDDFGLQVTSASVLPSPVGSDNDFDSCTTTGPGSNSWNNFPNGFLNSLNIGGGAVFNINYSDHNTPAPGSINYSISCEDSSGASVTDSALIIVANDCTGFPPPPPPSGNIKPIIIEQ